MRLRIELDAAFFRLYGLGIAEADEVLSSFRVLREAEEAQFGRFETKERLIEALMLLD
jgi:hypothetical protein